MKTIKGKRGDLPFWLIRLIIVLLLILVLLYIVLGTGKFGTGFLEWLRGTV